MSQIADPEAPPVVLKPSLYRRYTAPPALYLHYTKGELRPSADLLELFPDYQSGIHITVIDRGRQGYYIGRVKKADEGYWLNVQKAKPWSDRRPSSMVCNKGFVRDLCRRLGGSAGEVLSVPVAPHVVTASEIGLDPALFPHPFYRIVADQVSVKA